MVVTVLGAITPLGCTITETWERIVRHPSGVTKIIREDIGITALDLA